MPRPTPGCSAIEEEEEEEEEEECTRTSVEKFDTETWRKELLWLTQA
jgi:hypothetical protein